MAWMDALTPALKAAFAFIGVDKPLFVDAQPLQFANPEAREEALARARLELQDIARQWAA
jgi:FMN-dependent NADH-azoreductase